MKPMKTNLNTDKHILLASQQGDTAAFQKLVETYRGYAFSLAFRFLGNEEDALDVVQESFIRIWKHLHTFDHRCKFTTWMYRIVINLCRDRLKVQSRRNKFLLPDFSRNLLGHINITDDSDLEDKNIKEELAAVITALAGELPPQQRVVFVLRDLQDVGVEEVSQILGMSKSSVKSNLSYARKNIRLRLEQLEKNGRRKNDS
ncbi:MAG: sigma-70 family RNA polymerase sigma factor [Candidatus Aminicenantes bacterium]|nr:sigma-70 family RNA polymerase sigma factor [Candidatus Aminicenantes bacterium]NIQ66198.1 sigma-70 family RNA polymerase sigma factor [Candidatus Aminicenantes bacterium]